MEILAILKVLQPARSTLGKNRNWGASFVALMILPTGAIAAQDEKQYANAKTEEVIVTSEIIDRPLSASGHSVEIFDENTLRSQGALLTLRDILDVSPNLSLVTGTGKAPTVRGVDGTGAAENAIAFFAGSRARLSWQIDDRPASYNEIVFGDLGIFDVERVEVLRGAQSSLVGRNAIAGTVVVKTKDPGFDFDAAAQLASGNYQQERTSGMINLPLLEDKLAFRFAADMYQRNSAVEYEAYEGVDNPEQMKALSLRGKILYQPNKNTDTRLLFTVSHTEFEGPQGEIIVRPFADRVSNAPAQPVHKPATTSIIGNLALPLTDKLDFQLITSATDFDFERKSTTSAGTIDTQEHMLEPRLLYEADSGATAVAGIYYYHARQDEQIALGPMSLSFDDSSDTLAAYTEGLIPLTSSLDLSVGLRYEQEDRQRNGGDADGAFVQIAADESYDAFLPKAGINWKPKENLSFGAQISRGYNSGGSGVAFVFPIVNFEYDEETVWTGELFGRQEFMDGKLQTRQNIFTSSYEDMQLPFDLTPENSRDESFVIRNADKVNTIGAELGLNVLVSDNLNLFGNIGLLETEVTDFPDSGIEENELLTAPNFTANTGATWVYAGLTASMVVRYSDAYFTDVNNRPRGKTDPYVIADAQLGYDFGRVRIFATAKNMFDEEKPVARYPGINPENQQPDEAFDTAVMLQPRTYLVSLLLSY